MKLEGKKNTTNKTLKEWRDTEDLSFSCQCHCSVERKKHVTSISIPLVSNAEKFWNIRGLLGEKESRETACFAQAVLRVILCVGNSQLQINIFNYARLNVNYVRRQYYETSTFVDLCETAKLWS